MPKPIDPRPVLVTGANGFTGSNLSRGLARLGHHVRALVRPDADTGTLPQEGIEIVRGQLTDARDVARAARGVGTVYHIAAAFRVAGKPDDYFHEVNVGGTENVLRAVLDEGVDTLVHCSTIGIHGDCLELPCRESSPPNPGDVYQETKWEAELRVHEAIRLGMNATIVRPAGIYGPGDTRFLKLFETIDRGTFRMIGSGRTLFHMVYIDDLVDGIILCGSKPAARGNAYILAGPDWVTLNHLSQLVAEALDVTVARGKIPVMPVLLAGRMFETICRPLGIEPPLHSRRVHFFTKNRAFDISRARAELGYSPRVNTAEGVRRLAAWLIEAGHLPPRPATDPPHGRANAPVESVP